MRLGLFNRPLRGFRLVNVAALGLAMVMAMFVYWAKTSAAREATAIDDTRRQIVQEERRRRLLLAEIAYLERPDRLTQLAAGSHLGPVAAAREASPDALPQIATTRAVAQ